MNSLIACVTVVILSITNVYAQFHRTYGTANTEAGLSISTGNYTNYGYVVGGYSTSNLLGNTDALLFYTDMIGNQIFSYVYGGAGDEYFEAVDVSVNYNYPTAMVGAGFTTSFGAGSEDAFLVGVDHNGDVSFASVFGGAGTDKFNSIKSLDDGYIAVGESNSYAAYSGKSIYVVKVDLSGHLKGATIIGGQFDYVANGIERTSDGGYILVGATSTPCDYNPMFLPQNQIFVTKLDKDLNMEWNRIIGNQNRRTPVAFENTVATSVVVDGFDDFYISGFSDNFSSGSYDVLFFRMDRIGNLVMFNSYGTSGMEGGLDITFRNAPPEYTIVGFDDVNNFDAFLLNIDDTGTYYWKMNYGLNHDFDLGTAITFNESNRKLAFTGSTRSMGAGLEDVYLVQTDTLGSTQGCFEDASVTRMSWSPCISSSAQQVFVEEYDYIMPDKTEIDFTESECNHISKTTSSKSSILFPNPVEGELTVHLEEEFESGNVEIINAGTGKVMSRKKLENTSLLKIDIRKLKTGNYILLLKSNTGNTKSYRFIKN